MVKLDQHYVDSRLVDLYDLENGSRADIDFYISLAAELNARTIIDLGCGTGVLACDLAINGRKVIGVDPAAAMLAIARRKPNADRVQWIEGDSSAIGKPDADLAVMTGNVAQVFLDDAEWDTTLRNIHAALKSGGYIAFESRNPDVRAWEQWTRESTYEHFDSPHGEMECWLKVLGVENGRVRMEGHNIFTATGEEIVASSELRFRSLAEITDSLTNAGFTVEHVYGDWNRGDFTSASRFMVFIARRS